MGGISALSAAVTNDGNVKSDTWKETRSAARIKASLASAQPCAICKARLVISHASDDHIQRRADGGHPGQDNAQLTHHYCNHGFKEHFILSGKSLPQIELPS